MNSQPRSPALIMGANPQTTTMSIKNLSKEFQPREKAMAQGIDQLSDAELIALFLRTGTKKKSVYEIAHDALNKFGGIYNLSKMDQSELIKIVGIGHVKSLELSAVFEMSKRINYHKPKILKSNKEAALYASNRIGHALQEVFFIVILDNNKKITFQKVLSIGQEDGILISPRVLLSELLRKNARSFYCFHNHPSGNVNPSKDDLNMTKMLKYYCDIFGINLISHIIVGKNNIYYEIK